MKGDTGRGGFAGAWVLAVLLVLGAAAGAFYVGRYVGIGEQRREVNVPNPSEEGKQGKYLGIVSENLQSAVREAAGGGTGRPVHRVRLKDIKEYPRAAGTTAPQNEVVAGTNDPRTAGEKPKPPIESAPLLSTGSSGSAPRTSEEKTAPTASGSTKNGVAPAAGGDIKKTVPLECDFSSGGTPGRKVLFNEIAWMGSPAQNGETDALSANDEWMELKNNSDEAIAIGKWRLMDHEGRIKALIGDNITLAPGAFYLLERGDDSSVRGVRADMTYTGALRNGGAWLRLFDDSCSFIDEINALGGWPGGDNATKQTLERNVDGRGWHTSALPGGTPKSENSAGRIILSLTKLVASSTSSATAVSAAKYPVSVSLTGDGSGSVTSEPSGVTCGTDCYEEFSAGTLVALAAHPSADSKFSGWTGACTGKERCTVSITAETAVTAIFYLVNPPVTTFVPLPLSASQAAASSSLPVTSSSVSAPLAGVNHIVISAVQIAGAKADNDFVKLYNPTNAPVDIGGWKLRKRTKTGGPSTESSVRAFSKGSVAGAGGYFLWANSSDGFSVSVGANESSTATLAANNSIALELGDGMVIDALAWGSGHVNPFVEGSAYPDNPSANQQLKRKMPNGAVQDTDQNAADFIIE